MSEIFDNLLGDFTHSEHLTKLYVRGNRLWVFACFEDIEAEELELIREKEFQWKVVRIAHTSYLCFSPSGYSWNEVALLNSDESQELEELMSYRKPTIPIRFVGLLENSREIFTDRDFVLNEIQTEKLLSAVKSQQYISRKQQDDLNFLGDPMPLLKAMQFGDAPDILGIDVNETERTVEFRVNATPPRELKEPRARWILRHFEKLYGYEKLLSLTAMLENMAAEKIKREWKHCLIPVAIFQELEDISNREDMETQLKKLGYEDLIEEYLDKLPDAYYSAVFAALMFNWRYSKGIYNFDDDVLKSIYLASLPVHIKANIFTKLPEYCVYVKTPQMTDWNGKPVQGFFAMTEEVPVNEDLAELINSYYTNTEQEPLETESNLYLLIDGGASDESKDGRTNVVKMPIDLGALEECLELVEIVDPRPDERNPETEELIEWIAPFLNQLLYLCSEEPEIEHSRQPELKPETEDVKKTKKGLRLYAPSRVNEWLCGWRTGSFIKRQKERQPVLPRRTDEPTKTVKSHLRRAHWHTFYAGKRDAPEREVRIKWLQMIKVNFEGENTEKLPTVIKKVE